MPAKRAQYAEHMVMSLPNFFALAITTKARESHLVDIVGKLPLCDGPWALVVALEGCNLAPNHRGSTTAIVVHGPAQQKHTFW